MLARSVWGTSCRRASSLRGREAGGERCWVSGASKDRSGMQPRKLRAGAAQRFPGCKEQQACKLGAAKWAACACASQGRRAVLCRSACEQANK